MNNIFNMNNNDDEDDFNLKINLDELFEKKKAHDLSKLNIYKKLLGRIHVRIKTTARQNMDNQHCWFVVPEMIIGIPKYDQGACIAFLMDQLKENNFMVRYIHPNVLFISWKKTTFSLIFSIEIPNFWFRFWKVYFFFDYSK